MKTFIAVLFGMVLMMLIIHCSVLLLLRAIRKTVDKNKGKNKNTIPTFICDAEFDIDLTDDYEAKVEDGKITVRRKKE